MWKGRSGSLPLLFHGILVKALSRRRFWEKHNPYKETLVATQRSLSGLLFQSGYQLAFVTLMRRPPAASSPGDYACEFFTLFLCLFIGLKNSLFNSICVPLSKKDVVNSKKHLFFDKMFF